MVLSGYQLIEVNATVIIGLLILLTFQVFEDPHEEQFFDEGDSIHEITSEKTINLKLITQNCKFFQEYLKGSNSSTVKREVELKGEMCAEWTKTYEDLDERLLAVWNNTEDIKQKGGIDEFAFQLPSYLEMLEKGLILPFTISAIIEIYKSGKRKYTDGPSSKLARWVLLVGFIFLTIIFVGFAFEGTVKDLMLSNLNSTQSS